MLLGLARCFGLCERRRRALCQGGSRWLRCRGLGQSGRLDHGFDYGLPAHRAGWPYQGQFTLSGHDGFSRLCAFLAGRLIGSKNLTSRVALHGSRALVGWQGFEGWDRRRGYDLGAWARAGRLRSGLVLYCRPPLLGRRVFRG